MTTELEKQFFSTFGIKKRLISPCKHLVQNMYCDEDDICRDTYFNPFPNCVGFADCREDYKRKDERYPQITDKILLELICYMTVQQYQLVISNKRTVNDLKAYILKKCIKDYSKSEYLKHQVQQLFKESEQE